MILDCPCIFDLLCMTPFLDIVFEIFLSNFFTLPLVCTWILPITGPSEEESLFQLVFGKNGYWILCAKHEKDHPDCFPGKVQKPASVMVWGCIGGHGMGDLHISEGTIEAHVKNLETYAAVKMTTFPRNWDNARPPSAQVITATQVNSRIDIFRSQMITRCN